jgi:CDP-diacylglycerol--serine O-phosphatidyltransferase
MMSIKSDDKSSSKGKVLKESLNTVWGQFESRIGAVLPFEPIVWSWAKLLICSPLIAYGIWINTQMEMSIRATSFFTPKVTFWCFFLSLLFDFFRRSKQSFLINKTESSYDEPEGVCDDEAASGGQWIDRFCDFPLSIFATVCLLTIRPVIDLLAYLLVLRLVLELMTSSLLLWGRGPKRTRLRTVTSELSLYVILGLCLGLTPKLLTQDNAILLIGLQVVFSSLVCAYQLRLLQKRFIADTLSGLNFICGLISIYYSSQGRFETSLLFLLLGGAFDGFDGAAARKFGGTKFGVYSDDIADGMNYGIAPAFAVYSLMGGLEGMIIGAFYATFTISRLVYFTLNKDEGDPGHFAGVPSPVGGMIVMSSVVLFTNQPLWVSFLVGVSSTLMVSFKTPYIHIFRAFSWRSKERKRQALIGAPIFLIAFLVVTLFWGTQGAAAVILIGACTYGFIPSILSFYLVLFPPKS